MAPARWLSMGCCALLSLALAGRGGTEGPAAKGEGNIGSGSPREATAPPVDSGKPVERADRAKRKRGKIKVATIGAESPRVGADTAPADVVRAVIDHWKGRLAQVLPDRPDLIVVPEVCDRVLGLSSGRAKEYKDFRGSRIRDYFAGVARKNRCYIVYSASRKLPDSTWRNSSVLLDRKGEVAGVYDKNHPTIGEIDGGILPGRKATVVECDFGRVGFAICFDLNFNELRLQYAKAKPDIIVFSSMYHGGLMQSYWAYSCRSWFVGAIERRSPSQIRNPLGEVVASSTNYFDYAVTDVNLDCALVHLDYNWGRLRSLKKKYGRGVTISDPGYLGSVLVASEEPAIPVLDMLEEFHIELLDDYFQRSLKRRSDALLETAAR